MKKFNTKWLFTFYLLTATFAWYALTIWLLARAVDAKATMDIIAAVGASSFSGALIGWDTLVVQYWFRKKDPPVPPPP